MRRFTTTVQHRTIIHRDLGLKCVLFTNTPIIVVFYIYISQCSVATLLRCGGIFTNQIVQ